MASKVRLVDITAHVNSGNMTDLQNALDAEIAAQEALGFKVVRNSQEANFVFQSVPDVRRVIALTFTNG
jgi:hypothetical protein